MSKNISVKEATVVSQQWGRSAGEAVDLYRLTNSHGLVIEVTNLGGAVVSVLTPDREGVLDNVVLGFDSLEGYLQNDFYLGVLVGRYANRIAKGQFEMDGRSYQLSVNNSVNHLHGGTLGFSQRIWEGSCRMHDGLPEVTLKLLSKDGEDGYPGNLEVAVTYTLTNENSLRIEYSAVSDQTTLCNLTQHGYWNLGGANQPDVLDHELLLHCEAFTPMDSTGIPTGEIRLVADSAFDFRSPKRIGADVEVADPQIALGNGFDHNFVIDGPAGTLRPVAKVYESKSGRVLEMLSTDAGVQFYTGNFLNDSIIGKRGLPYRARAGFCLECQQFPDSPNQANFPPVFLQAGQRYEKTTVFKFSVE